MANGSRITIRVLRAQGHGVHGMLPHEQAWVELWIEDPKTRTVATQKRKGYPLVWDEEFVFDIGQTERGENQNAVEVHVYAKVRGEMATSGHDDIGVGEINVKKAPFEEEVTIPLLSCTGKDAGYLELSVKRE